MEIKFRVWDSSDEMMYYENTYNNGLFGLFKEFEKRKENRILMQFTGHKDKNGKEYYVGDIVRVYNCTYHKGYRDVHIESLENFYFLKFDDQIQLQFDDGEVIGNIYEDSKLLEEIK